MGDENPDFHPKVGNSVWYDYEDDWAEATVLKVTGKTYSLEVEGVGRVDNVAKADMLPVEYDDEEQEEGGDAEEGVDEDLQEVLDAVGMSAFAPDLAEAGIRSVNDLVSTNDATLKGAGITSAPQRKKLMQACFAKTNGGKGGGGGGGGRITVVFPAGPLGIDINQAGGRIKVTSAKGAAAEQGVAADDVLLRVGDKELASHLKDVPNDKKCGEVKKLVVSFPRPLEMQFASASSEAAHANSGQGANGSMDSGNANGSMDSTGGGDDGSVASTTSKKRWSLFGKKGAKGAEKDAASALQEVHQEEEDEEEAEAEEEEEEGEEEGGEEFEATFQAGSLGLSVQNDSQQNALFVTKSVGQAEANGVQLGDEIVSLNGKACKGANSEEFKKLVVGAGRPFNLGISRNGGGGNQAEASSSSSVSSSTSKAASSSSAKEDKKKADSAAEKKRKQKVKDEEERQRRMRQEEEEAEEEEAAAAAEARKKKDKSKQGEDDQEDDGDGEEEDGASSSKKAAALKVGSEVWYDNGDDWVEATITKMGAKLLTLKLQESGEVVAEVEKDWVAPMEYADDEAEAEGEEAAAKEEEEGGSDDESVDMMAMLASSSGSGDDNGAASKKGSSPIKKAGEASKALPKKNGSGGKAKTNADLKMSAGDRRRLEAEEAKKKKEQQQKKKSSSKDMGKGNFSKFKMEAVDKGQAMDSLHKARTAKMSYAEMITYASYHAGGGAKKATEGDKRGTEQQHGTVLSANLRKARSKSVEKRGPQISEGESHYQYMMRKKREEAEEAELEKLNAREEQARLREEKLQDDWDYRQKLAEEHEENLPSEEEEDDRSYE